MALVTSLILVDQTLTPYWEIRLRPTQGRTGCSGTQMTLLDRQGYL